MVIYHKEASKEPTSQLSQTQSLVTSIDTTPLSLPGTMQSVSSPTTAHALNSVHPATPDNVQECSLLPNRQTLATTHFSDITTLFNDLECRLRASLEGIVQSAILTTKTTMEAEWIKMKKAMESELESLSNKIAALNNRVVLLETKTSTSNKDSPTSEGATPTSGGATFDQLQSEVKQLLASIISHHKILEYNDRASGVKNVIIVSIAENFNEQTERVVADMLDQRLGLTDTTITQVRRIGRKHSDHY